MRMKSVDQLSLEIPHFSRITDKHNLKGKGTFPKLIPGCLEYWALMLSTSQALFVPVQTIFHVSRTPNVNHPVLGVFDHINA